jgi:2-methylcitrate dehydratase PrpD
MTATSPNEANSTDEAAVFAATLDASDVPERVADRARIVLADSIGAIVAGSIDPTVAELADAWTTSAVGANGNATVLGSNDGRCLPAFAAYLNGSAGTVLEMDEGHRFAAGHPAIHVVPAVLAEAEVQDASATDLLTALVAGYEVAVRAARVVVPLAEGYHPHGVWGAVGGAAGVARLRECDPETTADAISIAANDAQHTLFAAATEGATVRNTYAGASNLDAIVAVDRAEAGFTGVADGVPRHLAHAAAEDVNAGALSADLGARWEIQRGYFKRHAACRYTHAALDAVSALAAETLIDGDRVERVTVATYPAAAALDDPDPRNALQAKFSVPFAVASAIVHGDTGPSAFRDDAITGATRDLAQRVDVVVDDDIAGKAPDKRGARVTVVVDGEKRTASVETAKGGEHEPFPRDELREKFHALTASVLGDDRATALWQAIHEDETPQQICALTTR